MRARLVIATIAAFAVGLPALPALASSPPVDVGGIIADPVPARFTPNVVDGAIKALVQIGNRMVVGGTFTQVTPTAGPGTGTTVGRSYLFAFDAKTGALDTTFLPTVNGEVDSLQATADGTGVYAGGLFTSAGGANSVNTRLAQFNLADGQRVSQFNPSLNGPVNDMAITAGHLLVAGTFTTANNAALVAETHNGLVSLDPTTGLADPYVNIQLTGHHNYGRVPNAAFARTGAMSLAVSPDGTRAVVDGNFTNAADLVNPAGYARDQIASINLGAASATVDPNWYTNVYTAACFSGSVDSYVRDLAWSPDGTYFVVTTTGGYYRNSFQPCDAATAFAASSTGPAAVTPKWVDFTGTDSLYSVAITSSAVYVGGHQRWLNNPLGQDNPSAGAVPRPGLAALDTANGVPLSWNPGRLRGHGAEVVYATAAGVWVGSDTDWVGNYLYKRQKLDFFPFPSGAQVAGNNIGDAHAVFTGGTWSNANTFNGNTFDPSNGAGGTAATQPSTGGGLPWGSMRGAFVLNGRIWYGYSDGNFYYRTWDGANNFGPPMLVDPYNDPYWSNVKTGSGTTVFRGATTNFYAELQNVTGMFYANRSIYYTLSGNGKLFRRDFSPDTATSSVAGQVTGGVISPVEVTVVDPAKGGPVNFSNAGGMFVANGSLWYAARTTGRLYAAPWNGTNITAAGVQDASATGNWTGRAVFVTPGAPAPPPPPPAPTATFSYSCGSQSCTFDGSTSVAPGSTITSYAWDFGDGNTGTGVTTSHNYAAPGPVQVTLTVTNAAGGTGSSTQTVTVPPPPPSGLAFVGQASTNANAATETVQVPNNVSVGNGMLLLATVPSGGPLTAPAGWTLVDSITTPTSTITTTVWQRVAAVGDAGSSVSVTFGSGLIHGTLQLLAYSGTNPTNPVAGVAKQAQTVQATSYSTPPVNVPTNGDIVVSYWTAKSSGVDTWNTPTGQTARSTDWGAGGGHITSLLTDGGSAAAGNVNGVTATTTSSTGAMGSAFTGWSIVLG